MDLLIATGSVPLSGADTVPGTGTPQYATVGNPATSVAPTNIAAYHYNMMMAELYNLVVAAGLTPAGSTWTQVQLAASIIGRRLNPITSSSTFTVPANVYRLTVALCGGGGGAGSGNTTQGGAGGGAGGYAMGFYTVTPGATYTVTVGAGGSGGIYGGAAATAGGTTSFGALLSATGGSPGAVAATSSPGGIGGIGSGGSLNFSGGCGGDGNASGYLVRGNGGASAFGGGGRASNAAYLAVQNGQAPGSGAGAAYAFNGNGGSGAAGIVIVEY